MAPRRAYREPASLDDQIAFDLLLYRLFGGDSDVLVLDLKAQPIEDAHVNIGDPDEREPCDEVTAPAEVEHLEAGEDEEECGDVVREAVFAGEEIEELSRYERLAVLGALLAVFARLAK